MFYCLCSVVGEWFVCGSCIYAVYLCLISRNKELCVCWDVTMYIWVIDRGKEKDVIFFFNNAGTARIYTSLFVGSVRYV